MSRVQPLSSRRWLGLGAVAVVGALAVASCGPTYDYRVGVAERFTLPALSSKGEAIAGCLVALSEAGDAEGSVVLKVDEPREQVVEALRRAGATPEEPRRDTGIDDPEGFRYAGHHVVIGDRAPVSVRMDFSALEFPDGVSGSEVCRS